MERRGRFAQHVRFSNRIRRQQKKRGDCPRVLSARFVSFYSWGAFRKTLDIPNRPCNFAARPIGKNRKNVGTVTSFVSSDLKNSFWPSLGSICRPSRPGIAVRSLRRCGRGATPPGITLTYNKTRGLSPRFVNSWGRSSQCMSSGRHVPISSYRFGCGCIRSRV